MSNQDVFNGLSSNWLYASMSAAGSVRVHTEKPELLPKGGIRFNKDATCRRVDLDPDVINANFTGEIWERSQPLVDAPASYMTNGEGVPLPPVEVQVPECTEVNVFAQVPAAAMAPPAANRLTVDQAELGGLWDFANPNENYVSVNQYGVVWFNTHKDGIIPRRSYSVEVIGVTHPIERTRSQPQIAPPEAGKPLGDGTPREFAHPSLRAPMDPPEDDVHGWTNELDEAKARAKRLLGAYVHDGRNTRPALSELQYMAIFGEFPE